MNEAHGEPERYGWYSQSTFDEQGGAVYESADGGEHRTVTEVTLTKEMPSWSRPDTVYVGPVRRGIQRVGEDRTGWMEPVFETTAFLFLGSGRAIMSCSNQITLRRSNNLA